MKSSRRKFISTSAALATSAAIITLSPTAAFSKHSLVFQQLKNDRFDPWIEIIPDAARSNIKTLGRLGNNRPVLAVIKNNAYGLGTEIMANILENMPEVAGFAVVKTAAAISLRDYGIKKPILHMGMSMDDDFYELASKDIQLSIYSDNIRKILEPISNKLQRSVEVHQYIDTGMSRMGIPYHRALTWMQDIAASKSITVQGSFMGFTEDPGFDREQVRRFLNLNNQAKSKGIDMGNMHAASSNAVYHYPEASLDMIRPGIAIYGAYPSYPEKEKNIAELKVAYRLKTRVVRIEQLRIGDSVSYGRNYVADKPTWVATLPIGHTDGYPRQAVNGARVLIGDRTYPVIGAVSASHTILQIGDAPDVKIGDVATLVGPDHPEIHPNFISTITKTSVYDVLMHMNPNLPKVVL